MALLPVVHVCSSAYQAGQLSRGHLSGKRAQRAIKLPEGVCGGIAVRPIREWNGSVGVGARPVTFAGNDQKFLGAFGDRRWIPVGGNAAEYLPGDGIENSNCIVVRFGYKQAPSGRVDRNCRSAYCLHGVRLTRSLAGNA
jgi:hypothetical protein